jgi:hypothetical protein
MGSNDRELSVDELAEVSGGIKGALEGVCRKDEGSQGGKNDASQMFQQLLNQLS